MNRCEACHHELNPDVPHGSEICAYYIKTDARIERFIDDITRSLYVWRMARGMAHATNPSMIRSVATRRAKALEDIFMSMENALADIFTMGGFDDDTD